MMSDFYSEKDEDVFLDISKLDHDARHKFLERLYQDYEFFKNSKDMPEDIVENYKLMIQEIVKRFAH